MAILEHPASHERYPMSDCPACQALAFDPGECDHEVFDALVQATPICYKCGKVFPRDEPVVRTFGEKDDDERIP